MAAYVMVMSFKNVHLEGVFAICVFNPDLIDVIELLVVRSIYHVH